MKKADSEYFRLFYQQVAELLNEKRGLADIQETALEAIKQEIIDLERLLIAVAPFTSGMKIIVTDIAIVDGVAQLSLAGAIRKILEHNPQWRTPRGVRDSLQASGYDLTQHNNPLASIHGVLNRMAASEGIERTEINGKTRFRGKQPNSLQEITKDLKDNKGNSLDQRETGNVVECASR